MQINFFNNSNIYKNHLLQILKKNKYKIQFIMHHNFQIKIKITGISKKKVVKKVLCRIIYKVYRMKKNNVFRLVNSQIMLFLIEFIYKENYHSGILLRLVSFVIISFYHDLN